MYDNFITVEMLKDFMGLVLSTSLIVQFTKSIVKNKFGDVAVRLYTWIIALVLTFIFARNGQGIEGIVLTAINSILVATSAMGGYEIIADPKAEKKK